MRKQRSTHSPYEVVPAEGMVRHGRTTIRITVSAKKVCLSRPLIKALKNPSHIVFYRGVGENEGKVIIAATREDDDTEKILITPDRKNVYFWKSDFVSMCVKMVQKYAGGTFKRGTFYSVVGLPFDDEGFDAFVFDFREAAEHIVKNTGYNGRKQAAHPAFNMPRGYQAMMKKSTPASGRSASTTLHGSDVFYACRLSFGMVGRFFYKKRLNHKFYGMTDS